MSNISVFRCDPTVFERTIEDKTVEGWELDNRNDTIAILHKPGGYGSLGWHLAIAILLGWWLLFIPNVIYAILSHKSDKKELQIRVI